MGGLTSAIHSWEESQLRVLVLSSLTIQFFLLLFPIFRTRTIPGLFRFIMWLAYHAGDAVAIYALVTLFNRHKDQADGGVGGGSNNRNMLLEVVWAPVLLIHLGGGDGVTAYNIEDNELWTRHLLTAVSQVTVAVYVFCKSLPTDGDKRLLQTAILLFILGVVKCFVKAWAFKKASINSLASSVATATAKQKNDGNMFNTELEAYVEAAKDIGGQQQAAEEEEEPAVVPIKKGALACLRELSSSMDEDEAARELRRLEKERLSEECGEAYKLFVDISSPYPRRIGILKKFWELSEEGAYDSVQEGLASAFFLLYTKLKISISVSSFCILILRIYLPWASIGLFHHSHREAYNGIDVKVTYAILCCTALLETNSLFILLESSIMLEDQDGLKTWPEAVAQYSLAGYFVRYKKHNIKMGIVSFFQCKDLVDQLWCMKPCFTSARITYLVLGYLKDGWRQKIQDAATYRGFINRSNWGLDTNTPFDECVLLWHLATDFCFFSSSSFRDHNKCAFAEPPPRETPRPGPWWPLEIIVTRNPRSTTSTTPRCIQKSTKCKSVQCRQMSNYMVYLLFVNPEMLLPGSRRNLFKAAYKELKDILNLKDWKWNPVCWSRCTPCGVRLVEEEGTVMDKLIEVIQKKTGKRASQEESSNEVTVEIEVAQEKPERSSEEQSSMEGSNRDENFIHRAWALAQRLMEMDETERWKQIQRVWVEMLCFSASRSRGYLHAKALGKGGEFLSYIWLLLFYMGMETFSERLQRDLLPSYQGNNDTAPPQTSELFTNSNAPSASTVHSHAGAGNTASPSEICNG